MWITLCVNWYKAGFCWGLQQSVIFLSFKGCGVKETPYNATPLRRNNGKQAAGSAGLSRRTPAEKSEIKRLTLKEESVIYATSQQ